MHQYYLLYEEITYTLNYSDIGHIETLFPVWIYIFRGVGKHKYGNQMEKFMTDLYFLYPEQLKHVVQYNMLVNPTGQPSTFHGVDWVVELNNLYTKVIYVHSSVVCMHSPIFTAHFWWPWV
jgi:hypothetical protein